MELTSEVMTYSQFSALWKHVKKNSYSGLRYSLRDIWEEASGGFLNTAVS